MTTPIIQKGSAIVNSIISVLASYNQLLLSQIHQLLVFIAKNIPLKLPKLDLLSSKYNKYTVDKLPVVKTLDKLNYKHLLNDYISQHSKELKPIKPRGKIQYPLTLLILILELFLHISWVFALLTMLISVYLPVLLQELFAADETYVKVKGVRHYVWFIMDALKKSILEY